ncbi:MAG: peptidoglycan DD-metalloendopeptidase family protein [Lutibacter sp.]|nr:peptidoglycan DD-metalloendopeptidase family protein [Lutibacter sp.]MDP3945201.1 peptidoglycan DD-metalloendopeptidase family protein [Lutibacter sp.]
MQFKIKYIFLFSALFLSVGISAQDSKRDNLEARKNQIKKEIVYLDGLLKTTIKAEKNLLVEVKDLTDKIKKREELITVISHESSELGNEIYTNQLEINKNQRNLEALKKDYSQMIFKSYKSKSQNSRIMFLLSSENFYQGYKRFQYMKQYSSFRKNQAEEIQRKTIEIQALTDTLISKKKQKQDLLTEQQQERIVIQKEKKEQERLLSQVKEKENKYKRQITQFQREERKIDAQIDKIIRDAIAASNKNTSKPTSTTFTLTAEAKELATKFTSNKGQLPWPVEKGFVSTYYGKQPHPVVKTTTIQSNGVRITTDSGSKARAVFEGTVLSVQVMGGNLKAVLIQHGDYISVYKNLENVFVNTGQKVKTKQEIGTIFTDKITGKTILGFVLSRNVTTEDPAYWIYKM